MTYMAMDAGEVFEYVRKVGPSTEHEIIEALSKAMDSSAIKSQIRRKLRRKELRRVVTVEKKRPVWLYYLPEQEKTLFVIKRVVWVPLKELGEFKKSAVTEAFEELRKEGYDWATLEMIAQRVGLPPSGIKREVYAVAKEKKFRIYKDEEEAKRMRSGSDMSVIL